MAKDLSKTEDNDTQDNENMPKLQSRKNSKGNEVIDIISPSAQSTLIAKKKEVDELVIFANQLQMHRSASTPRSADKKQSSFTKFKN